MNLNPTQTTKQASIVAPSSKFTEAMSALASGVVMVTTWLDGRPWGMTVNAFASVSADPPTVLVSLRSDAAGARAVEEAGSFGVSILGRRHRVVARHGSTPGAAKFLERFAERSPGLSPSILGALAHLDCDVIELVKVADHTLFIGRVRGVQTAAYGEPLIYFRRAYRTLAPSTHPSTERRTPCLSS